MKIRKLSNDIDTKQYLKDLGVDSGGIDILSAKMTDHLIFIQDLHVGAANILKQDALSVGADLAVPRGTVVAAVSKVDCILIANSRELAKLAKKELQQPFGLKDLAKKLGEYLRIKKPKSTEIMGIINANDDSFFSGSRFKDGKALKAIYAMIEDGADIVDIGGVSSRPNALEVDPKEELSRVVPIIDAIAQQKLYEKVKLSIDSYTPKVIAYALERGFHIVNDITGLQNDAVCKLCAGYNATAVIMHMQGTPQIMQQNPSYENILTQVYHFLETRIHKAESFGIKDIVLDVGIGFGKTLEHNISLIKYLENFLILKKRLLIGASRKSMIDMITPSLVEERLPGSLAIHLEAVKNGASIVRVHDVKEHYQALKVLEAFRS